MTVDSSRVQVDAYRPKEVSAWDVIGALGFNPAQVVGFDSSTGEVLFWSTDRQSAESLLNDIARALGHPARLVDDQTFPSADALYSMLDLKIRLSIDFRVPGIESWGGNGSFGIGTMPPGDARGEQFFERIFSTSGTFEAERRETVKVLLRSDFYHPTGTRSCYRSVEPRLDMLLPSLTGGSGFLLKHLSKDLKPTFTTMPCAEYDAFHE